MTYQNNSKKAICRYFYVPERKPYCRWICSIRPHPSFFSQIHRVGMPFEQRTEKMLSSQLKNSAISVNGGSNMT